MAAAPRFRGGGLEAVSTQRHEGEPLKVPPAGTEAGALCQTVPNHGGYGEEGENGRCVWEKALCGLC